MFCIHLFLLTQDNSRDVKDVAHKVIAVGSRSVESAQKFIDKLAGPNSDIRACGSYDEVYNSPVRLESLPLGILSTDRRTLIRM